MFRNFAYALVGLLLVLWGGDGSAQGRQVSNETRVFFVAINVTDLEKSRDFYVQLVGMTEVPPRRPSSSPGIMLNFTGSKADPFILLVPASSRLVRPGLLVPAPDQQIPVGEGSVLNRLALFVPDVEAVTERVRAAGYAVINEPQAPNPEGLPNTIVSFVSDPDGNDVEFVQD